MVDHTTNLLSPRDGYAAWAKLYDADGNPLLPLEEPAMREMWGDVRGLDVLDLGCGTGRHTVALAVAGARVTGVDQSPEMLAVARQKLEGSGVRWVEQGLPGVLPFDKSSFDLVVSGLVFEHLPDVTPVFAEIARLLRPGGRVIISALHPDRTAEGQTARFIDPTTGERRPIFTAHRSVEQYHHAAESARLSRGEARTLVVPPELAELFPRAARWIGLPLGWVASWGKQSG